VIVPGLKFGQLTWKRSATKNECTPYTPPELSRRTITDWVTGHLRICRYFSRAILSIYNPLRDEMKVGLL
jgi:hypothetical protein